MGGGWGTAKATLVAIATDIPGSLHRNLLQSSSDSRVDTVISSPVAGEQGQRGRGNSRPPVRTCMNLLIGIFCSCVRRSVNYVKQSKNGWKQKATPRWGYWAWQLLFILQFALQGDVSLSAVYTHTLSHKQKILLSLPWHHTIDHNITVEPLN